MVHDVFTLAKGLELNNQWSSIVGNGPDGVLDLGLLVDGAAAGLMSLVLELRLLLVRLLIFVRQVVVHRRDFSVRGWRNWVLEDPLVHPYRWLPPDLVPPATFLNCDPKDTVDASGVLVEPHVVDEQLRKAFLL